MHAGGGSRSESDEPVNAVTNIVTQPDHLGLSLLHGRAGEGVYFVPAAIECITACNAVCQIADLKYIQV